MEAVKRDEERWSKRVGVVASLKREETKQKTRRVLEYKSIDTSVTRASFPSRSITARPTGRTRGREGGRDTCMATQQFRVKCYVSESVMPMWAEANL